MDITQGQAAVIAALIAASAAILAPHFHDWWRQGLSDRRSLSSFYGELANIYRHYSHSYREVPDEISHPDFKLRLALAEYGTAAVSRRRVARIPLEPDEINRSMEMLILIRNNDIRVQELQKEGATELAGPHLRTLKSRMKDCRDLAKGLLVSIYERKKTLFDPPPLLDS